MGLLLCIAKHLFALLLSSRKYNWIPNLRSTTLNSVQGITHKLCDSLTHLFSIDRIGMKKKIATPLQQRGGNSEAVGGEMKPESGRMNFIQKKKGGDFYIYS